MGDHVDAFCPDCGANVGLGTIETIGCPVCGYEPEEDKGFEEEEFEEE